MLVGCVKKKKSNSGQSVTCITGFENLARLQYLLLQGVRGNSNKEKQC